MDQVVETPSGESHGDRSPCLMRQAKWNGGMMRATYTGSPGNWKGAIRDDNNKLIWKCPHLHRNRDHGYEVAAQQCSRSYLHNPEEWEKREAQRIAWIESRRTKGWS